MDTVEASTPAFNYVAAVEDARSKFFDALDNDLKTPEAYAVVFALKKQLNKNYSLDFKNAVDEFLLEVSNIFLFFAPDILEEKIPDFVTYLADERQQARMVKNWEKADLLRKHLAEAGYQVKDTADGYTLTVG